MAAKSKTVDLAKLNDNELVGMIVAARQEAQRRGIATEAEVWASALSDEETTRVAREAAERETRRLREEEARRIAAEAAERVRREAEQARQKAESDEAADAAARLRAIATEARGLFGSDEAEFTITLWAKPGDRRIYIGHGYGANWVEYHHDGDARTAPGTLKAIDATVKPLAAHLGYTAAEAREKIKAFCADLIGRGFTGKLEVNSSNAPVDPSAVVRFWRIKVADPNVQKRYASKSGRGAYMLVTDPDKAIVDFATEAEAQEAIPVVLDTVPSNQPWLNIKDSSQLIIEQWTRRIPFAPKD